MIELQENKDNKKNRIPVKYIHAMQGGTVCNLKCSYCYVPITSKSSKPSPIKFKYSTEQMLKALSKERLGGVALINYVGGGETFLSEQTFEIIKGLLEEGHYMSVVTNTTVTKEIEKLCNLPDELKDRILIQSSLHYVELKRLNLIDVYFDNLNKLKKAGISFYIIYTYDENDLPYLEEVRDICLERLQTLPSPNPARDAANGWGHYPFWSEELQKRVNKIFNLPEGDSSLLEKRNEFCYAGDWSFMLNMENGEATKCFVGKQIGNIFENPNEKIKFEAIGKCPSEYCACGMLLLSSGVIPELDIPSFGNSFKERTSINNKVLDYLDFKLKDTNQEYTEKQKRHILNQYREKSFIEKQLRVLISCLIPNKELRHKIKG